MNASLSSSVKGVKTAITRHDVTAHDVANVNTKGYTQRTPHQVETVPRGVRISHISRTPNRATDRSNTDLAEESKEQIVNKHTLTANAKAIKVQDRMLGEVVDLVG